MIFVRSTTTAEGLWPLAYLTFMLLYNLVESSMKHNNIMWVLFVAVILSTGARSPVGGGADHADSDPSSIRKN